MPLSIQAVYSTLYLSNGNPVPKESWLQISGATAGADLAAFIRYQSTGSRSVTLGYGTASESGKVLIGIPNESNTVFNNSASSTTGGFVVRDMATAETVTVSGPWISENNRDRGSWTVSQDASRNITVSCTSLGVTSACPLFTPLSGASSYGNGPDVTLPPEVWEVSLVSNSGSVLATQNVRPPMGGALPQVTFASSSVVTTGDYFVKIKRSPYSGDLAQDDLTAVITTTLTAPSVTTGGNANMFSWLNNDYWWLTDLQVNLATRAVTHRHGTVEIKPNDTINFAVLFHDGSAGKDPVATDLRLAVRSASNASAYYFWANPSVTTTSVSGDIYYTITVTASDEDLLAAQAASLLSGSAAAQSLLAEVQWTTTRGTFTSDTFTIQVPSEVIREPDA